MSLLDQIRPRAVQGHIDPQKDQLELLDNVLLTARSLNKDERDLLRARAFGAGRREIPDLPLGELRPTPPRTKHLHRPERLGSALSSSGSAAGSREGRRNSASMPAPHKLAAGLGEVVVGAPAGATKRPTPHRRVAKLPTVDRRRVRELQNGKSLLSATTDGCRAVTAASRNRRKP